MAMPAVEDHQEQVLIRRVVTVVCGLALATVPFAGPGGDQVWVNVANLVVLLITFGLLGRTRLQTSEVITGAAMLFWAVSLVSVGGTAAAAVAGRTEGIGLGTGALWLAAGIGPALFLAVPLRRAVVLSVTAAVGFLAMVLVAAGGNGALLLDHPGVVQVVFSVLVVLGATVAVAWLAGRSAVERREALRRWEEQAATAAVLAADQRRRATLFSRTAEELREPMAELVTAVEPLRAPTPAPTPEPLPAGAAATPRDDRPTLDHVRGLAATLLERIEDQMDGLAARAREVAEGDEPGTGEPLPTPDDASDGPTIVLMTFAVFAVVGLDAWRLTRLGADLLTDPHLASTVSNRMVVVLFLAAAVLAVRFPGRFGWVLTGLALLTHPVVLVSAVDPASRSLLLPSFAAAWRLAALAAAMLALLATIIERRVRDRDAFVVGAGADEVRTRELLRRDRAADLAYAEAAHELKNPLQVILGSAEVLDHKRDLLDPGQAASLRTALVQGVGRLEARLHVMREVASTGPLPGRSRTTTPSAAADVLLDALQAARPALEEHAVDVDVRVTGAWTTAAPDDVEHVVENLLGNAHKYGDADQPIRFTARRAADGIKVEVANRGGGLTVDDASRMFEPYWRAAATAGGPAGTGIGLALVARLVDGWGGRCWATVGDGWTRVGFLMPLADSVPTATLAALEEQLH